MLTGDYDDFSGYPGCLVHSKDLWTVPALIGPQSVMWPSGGFNILWVTLLGQRLGVRSHKSAPFFGYGNWVVPSSQKNHWSRWIANEVAMQSGRNELCGETCTWLLFYLSLIVYVFHPWFWWRMIWAQVCAKYTQIWNIMTLKWKAV